MRMNRQNRPTSLFRKIVLPVIAIMTGLVLLLTVISSSIIIAIQNDQTKKSVRQSLDYAHGTLWSQFSGIKNMIGFLLSNQDIENILEKQNIPDSEAIDDYYHLFTEFQNISLMSLLNDISPNNQIQISYIVTVIVGPSNGLYEVAASRFAMENGIYKDDEVADADWYRRLFNKENDMVWWTKASGAGGHLYAAKRKISTKDGSHLGTVVVAYDLNNIKGILNESAERGRFVLLDESNRVVYSNPYGTGDKLDRNSAILSETAQAREGLFERTVDEERSIVAFNQFDNGWKLVFVVPERSLRDYTALVAGIAFGIGAVGMVLASLLIRRIAYRVTGPIGKLAQLMKRVQLGDFQAPAQVQPFRIEEVDVLFRGYANMIRKLNELIEEVYVKDIAKKQLQLELLQAQINPHFLYNTLDMINCKALSIGDKEISVITRSLANVLRFGLNKGQQVIRLRDELKQVSSYLEIQKMMSTDLTYTLLADESLADVPVIHFIVQPLVENCIVHGFREKRFDRRIAIRAALAGDELVIEVEDNGSGLDADGMNRLLADGDGAGELSFGTRNVDRRIKLYCGSSYGLKYSEQAVGTLVRIHLPLQVSP